MICVFLSVAVLTVYWQVQFFGLIDYDDVTYVVQNRHVKAGLTWEGLVWALGDIHTGYWHPLTWLSHMLDYQLFRAHFGGHHWSSVILHIINTVVLYLVCKKMTGETWKCAFVAGLFALHPLNVESVAWVAERKNVLSTLFWFAAMWLYVYYVAKPGLVRYIPVLLCFVMGLMTKPILVTFPFVLLLLDYWPLGRLDSLKAFGRLLLEKIPFFILAALISIGTFLAGRYEGTVATFDTLPLSYRIENALLSYVRYMGKMFWPDNLAVFYPYEMSVTVLQVVGATMVLTCISALAIVLSRRYRYAAVGWLWYLGTLVPVIGFVQSGEQAMADRYAYVSLIGLFIAVVWGVADIVERWRYRRVLYVLLSGTVMIALMICTWFQIQHWQNSVSLFGHALTVTRANYVAHNNFGIALLSEGKFEEAMGHFIQAVQIKPFFSEAHNNLGMVMAERGILDGAREHYQKALIYKPNNERAHNNLGIALAREGRLDDAMKHFREALNIKPDYADASHNMGSALARQGRVRESIEYFQNALQLDPENAMTHNNIGMALSGLGEFEKAIMHFDEALKINPFYKEAFYNRQAAMKRIGREQ